jgi:hypothetical protein
MGTDLLKYQCHKLIAQGQETNGHAGVCGKK